ncbi:MAG TPA: hypothetical protein VN577_07450 [Terriglobales bacterium]|nr:hypothetical protein [Terriglobales bacterium]
MGLDIRTPIGLMFSVLGLILVSAGLFIPGDIHQKSLGINLNLWWGLLLVLFGVLMLVFGLRSGKTPAEDDHVEH